MTKVFQILVPDDKLVSRIISCDNQVSELFVIERADKDFISQSEEDLNKPALYILINRDLKKLYVGETEDSFKRLKNHEAKDFWIEAIVFHRTNDILTTTDVRWLEAKTYEVIADLGYYDLSENKQVPKFPKLKRNQRYSLEPLFDEAKAYICAAGFDIFLRKKTEEETQEEEQGGEEDTHTGEYYLTEKPSVAGYYSSIQGTIIKETLKELNMPESIFEITDLNSLEKLRIEVARKEKERGTHNQYACSISQLKHYIENGFTYKEFEHDAMYAKKKNKENKKKKD